MSARVLTPLYSITLPESRQTHSDDAGTPSNTSTDIPGLNNYAYSDLITRRIAHLQSLSSSLHHYHAYRETLPAIIDAYKSGNLTIERGQLTFWARGCQLGPARKFEIPTTEDESLRQQVRVMGMLDEVLKVQDRGDLLWIENVSRLFLGVA